MSAPSPDSKIARVEQLVLDQLARAHSTPDLLPTTVRFLFYELEQRGEAEKPQPGDTRTHRRRSVAKPGVKGYGWPPGSQDVNDAITRLREAGDVPWDWFADTERSLRAFRHAPTIADYLIDTLDLARINPFHPKLPPLILTESNGMALVLERLAVEYRVPIAGTKGMAAGFLRTEIAPLLTVEVGTSTFGSPILASRDVLYLGDHDRSGFDIEANSKRTLRAATKWWTGDWERIGLLPSQTTGLTPIYKVDGRDKVASIGYEVEALGQAEVIRLVRAALDARLPQPLSRVLEREKRQRRAAEARLR